jgi:MFS family permease
MTLTSGAFLTGYALLLGANDFELALLLALPMLAQGMQLPGAYWVERSGKRRNWVRWFSGMSRMLWLPMALVPLLELSIPHIWVFLGLFGLAHLLMQSGVPAWITWMADLVPKRIRGRYFSQRNRLAGSFAIACSLGGGFVIDHFRGQESPYSGYLTLFLVAVGAALIAFFLIGRQPEPATTPQVLPSLHDYLVRPFRDPGYRRILTFYIALLFPVGVSAPYFSAHLIKTLEWDFRLVAATSIGTALTSIFFEPFWGRLIDRHGHRPVLMLCAMGIVQLPLYYALSPYSWYWPFFANALLAGVFWPGFNLAMFNLLLSATPQEGKAGFLAMQAALNGFVNFLASGLGGILALSLAGTHLMWQGLEFNNYQLLFFLSAGMRLPCLLLLRKVEEPKATGTFVLVRRAFITLDRTISFGRHILAVPKEDRRP